jgi:hypothetical protein
VHLQISREFEHTKARLEEELLATAQLVTKLEGRLRDATDRAHSSTTAAEVAAARAAAAEAAVASEVEARMAAVGGNRALWPAAAREEVGRLEQKNEALQGMLGVLRGEGEKERQQLVSEQQAKEDAQRRCHDTEERLLRIERDMMSKQRELEGLLDYAQKDADALRGIVGFLEQERDEARLAAEAAAAAAMAAGGSGGGVGGGGHGIGRTVSRRTSVSSSGSLVVPDGLGSTGMQQQQQHYLQRRVSNGGSSSASPMAGAGSGSGKWQVQNHVGGGSLYGVADERNSVGRRGGGGEVGQKVGGVDWVYLKNVLLKFLEAVVAGKTAERDALLPAIAALVQATPVEFQTMKKVLANTAPAGSQMLSVLGIKL